MQPADKAHVLGAFDGRGYEYNGRSHRFFERDGRPFVRTDGLDGIQADYEISHTFGATPLQQYLVSLPDGRRQVLGHCWDSRPAADGGQRWFHLYPDDQVDHGSPFHWARPLQNWNSMCAECHSTGFEKRYDADTDRFDSRWFEIDVSCESCHGPGSAHVEWAKSGDDKSDATQGLLAVLGDRDGGQWTIGDDGVPQRGVPRASRAEVETCARCHSRRTVLGEDYVPGRSLLQTHVPALLHEPLYYVDGQVRDEVYVYGSFRQSKMYHEGVTCSDCHDAHSGQLLLPGNELCGRCHPAQRFDTPEHHHHAAQSPGAQCVECHMPETHYMVVDPRRDHSLRVPRPDLTEKLGVPNACNVCHADRTVSWAQAAVQQWYPDGQWRHRHYGEILHNAETQLPDALAELAALTQDEKQPTIVRATALASLGRLGGVGAHRGAIEEGLRAADPLMRLAAVGALDWSWPEAARAELGGRMLDDPIRAVRLEAARVLAPVRQQLGEERARLDQVLAEYISAQHYNADRGAAHHNLADLFAATGDDERAEAAYRRAIELQPFLAAAYANLADLYRRGGRDPEGEATLQQGLQRVPDDAGLQHAFGLLLVRGQRFAEALEALSHATRLAPENSRYAYIHGVALAASGDTAGGIAVLARAHSQWPGDVNIVQALLGYHTKLDQIDQALVCADRLRALRPGDLSVQRSIQELQRRLPQEQR